MKREAFILADALSGLGVVVVLVWILCLCWQQSLKQEQKAYIDMQANLALLKKTNQLESEIIYQHVKGAKKVYEITVGEKNISIKK